MTLLSLVVAAIALGRIIAESPLLVLAALAPIAYLRMRYHQPFPVIAVAATCACAFCCSNNWVASYVAAALYTRLCLGAYLRKDTPSEAAFPFKW